MHHPSGSLVITGVCIPIDLASALACDWRAFKKRISKIVNEVN